MKKKVFYRFNPHTLVYDRVFPTRKDKFLVVLRHLISGIFIGLCVFWFAIYFIDSPKEQELEKEMRLKETQYNLLSKRMDEAVLVLQDIQQRDDFMYRSIFNAEPIPSSIRNSGVGGIGKYEHLSKLSNPELIIQTTKKMDLIRKQIYIQSNSFDEILKIASKQKDRLNHYPSIQPISDKYLRRVASGYGPRNDPIHGTSAFHAGMDFSSPTGTPVYSTADGVIEFADWRQGYGKCIIVDHGYDYKTLYAHLDEYVAHVGQKVNRGEKIGEVGNTGKSTAPHLHYEVRYKGEHQNPARFYYGDLSPEQYEEMRRIASNRGQVMD